jgi:hypothetical protein
MGVKVNLPALANIISRWSNSNQDQNTENRQYLTTASDTNTCRYGSHSYDCNSTHIMLRDLLTQIAWNKNWLLILDTPKHVDSENIKLKIGCGTVLYQLFSKRDFNS